MKIIIPLFMAIICFSNAYAKGEFYAGIQGGGVKLTDKKEITTLVKHPFELAEPIKNISQSRSSGMGGIFVGYGNQINNFYFGIETEADFGKVSSTMIQIQNENTFSVREKITQSYALTLVPGYSLCNSWLIYGKLGVIASRFKSSATDAGRLGFSGQFAKWLSGMRTGIGIQTRIKKNLALRLEYNYSRYQSFSKSSQSSLGIPPEFELPPATIVTHYQPSTQGVLLGISYYFIT